MIADSSGLDRSLGLAMSILPVVIPAPVKNCCRVNPTGAGVEGAPGAFTKRGYAR